jgi:poly-gamma-glutamate synthesis protein (capsule biosynthesis protein)
VAGTIALLGDVMLGRGVADRLATAEPGTVWAPELRELTAACDIVICNLECCISKRGAPTALIPAKPFFFRAPPAAVEALQAIGVDAAGLANNHALDYGPEALADTIELLGQGGIAVAGAGRGPDRAREGAIVDAGGRRLGLLAFSDHPYEFAAAPARLGIAFAERGANGDEWVLAALARLRERCDLVVAFPHWGPNMSARPSRPQRDLARRFVEAGADIVAGHSAHVFHGVEWVSGRPVAYDLGDALDDYAVDADLRNDLGILVIWHPQEEPPSLGAVGLRLDFCYTGLATGDDADWIAARLARACAELGTAVERTGEQRFVLTPTG